MPKIENWGRSQSYENDIRPRSWRHDELPQNVHVRHNQVKYFVELPTGEGNMQQTALMTENKQEAIDYAVEQMRKHSQGFPDPEESEDEDSPSFKKRRRTSPSKPRGKTPERLKGRRPRDR